MARPQFFLIAGPNGAGKSTFTSIVRRRFPKTKVIDPDAIAKEVTGSYSNIAEQSVFAGKEAIRQVRACISSGHSFAVESTISGNSYLRYASNAKAAGFRTVLVYIALSSPSLSAERVKIRVSKGGHTIPEHDLQRRYPKSLENLSKHIEAFENAYILDNSHPNDVYHWVAMYRQGKLRKNRETPPWLETYLI
ncbi:MAG: zeta toxin family protein [Pseudomonadota bacterium]